MGIWAGGPPAAPLMVVMARIGTASSRAPLNYRVKSHAWCLGQSFRGSYALLVQFMEVTVLTTALEIRTEFEEERRPIFEVVGPWDHIF